MLWIKENEPKLFDRTASVLGTRAEELTRSLGKDVAAPGTITFLPYLSGERTPHNDAAIRGVFAGLSHEHDRNDMTRAVLEGDAFGAARLGLIADTGEAPLEICFEPTIAETIEPAAAMADAFEQAFERYRALYPAISSIGKRLCY